VEVVVVVLSCNGPCVVLVVVVVVVVGIVKIPAETVVIYPS